MSYKIYAADACPTTLNQFHSAIKMDWAVQAALMPDAHAGYSLPIGGVVATDNMVVPAWQGYDIGCGLCAIPFETEGLEGHSESIFNEICSKIPVGFNIHQKVVTERPEGLSTLGKEVWKNRRGAMQLGTLGGGNHFIEVGKGGNKYWLIIHSGSRGFGHGLAGEYTKLASGSRKAKEGHFGLEATSELGQQFMNDSDIALQYALDNRLYMVKEALKCVRKFCPVSLDMKDLINRNHNHIVKGDIDGKEVWVHRKGATHAELGMDGVIPGNMRDGTFIVRGLGNPESLSSSSHGAGRVLSRSQAKRELSVTDFEATMTGIHAKVGASTIDEAPAAYKDIFAVMDAQKDLVEITDYVKPILNIKG